MNFLKRLLRGKIEETKQQIEVWRYPDRLEESMPCDEILVEGVDRPLYEKLLSRALSEGTIFTGGMASLHGITLHWAYDESSGNLHITPLMHPWWAKCSAIKEEIEKIVAKAKTGDL